MLNPQCLLCLVFPWHKKKQNITLKTNYAEYNIYPHFLDNYLYGSRSNNREYITNFDLSDSLYVLSPSTQGNLKEGCRLSDNYVPPIALALSDGYLANDKI